MRELYQVVEVGPAWYQENIPCQEACPVKTNCRGYLNLAAAGEFEKGWELALDPNPMASICGSVCAAPCETACRPGSTAMRSQTYSTTDPSSRVLRSVIGARV